MQSVFIRCSWPVLKYVNCRSMEGKCALVRKEPFFSRYLGNFVVNIAFVYYRLRQEK